MAKMKISENLAVIKQKESEIKRLSEQRTQIAQMTFSDTLKNLKVTELPEGELEKRESDFRKKQKDKYNVVEGKIDVLMSEVIGDKNQVNKMNVSLGIDKMLLRIKFLRIELSRLMAIVDGRMMLREVDTDTAEMLGITKRIKKLETEKIKLDSQVQHLNATKTL